MSAESRASTTRAVVSRMNLWGLGFGVLTGAGLLALSPVLPAAFTSDPAVRHALVPVLDADRAAIESGRIVVPTG